MCLILLLLPSAIYTLEESYVRIVWVVAVVGVADASKVALGRLGHPNFFHIHLPPTSSTGAGATIIILPNTT